jgi:anti-sigma factor RsiW
MTDCPNIEIRDQLPDFVHDQLSAAAHAAVARHVATCPVCAAEVKLLRELRRELRAAPSVDVERIVAALPAPSRVAPIRQPGRGGWRRLDWRIAAAVVALIVGGGSAVVVTSRARAPEVGATRVVEDVPARPQVQEVAAADLSIDADLGDASLVELEALLDELEAFDGLPAGEPEPPASPGTSGEGL